MNEFDELVENILHNCIGDIEKKIIQQESIVGLYYITEYMKQGFSLSSKNKMMLDKLVFSFKTDKSMISRVSTDIRYLITHFFLASIQNIKHEKKRLEEFFSIYIIFENYENIIENKELIHLLFPQEKLSEYLKHLYKAFKRDKKFMRRNYIDQEKMVFKLFYITLFIYERSKEPFYELFNYLYKIFEEAIKLKLDDLVLYLYVPLQFSCCGVSKSQEEFKEFNEKVEKRVEEYVQSELIPRFELKAVDKQKVSTKKPLKIAFVQERLMNYSIHNAFFRLLQELKKINDNQIEITVIDLNFPQMNGSNYFTIEEMKQLGFPLIDAQEKFSGEMTPFYSPVQKCLKLREYIIEQNIDVLIGLHSQVEYNFLFTTRSAPLQIYWSHGDSEYDIEGIDKKITHMKPMNNQEKFETFLLPTDKEKYNPPVDKKLVQQIREQYPKDAFILGYIGRLIKIEDDEYLKTISTIMKQNPHTIFLACGSGEQENIRKKVDELGIGDRFYFTGHIDSHVYGHVIDYFLASFHSGGEALGEYAGKGKPYLLKVNKEVLSKHQLEMYESTILQYGYARYFALSNEDFINVANKLINESVIRKKLIDYIKKEYIERKFGSIAYFLQDLGYYSGKGFIELLLKISQQDIHNNTCKQLEKLDYYKIQIEEVLKKFEQQENFNVEYFIEELATGNLEKRAYYNYIIAEYLYQNELYNEAKIYIGRAWLLFQFHESILTTFIKINEAVGDIDAIYEAYKRLGMISEKQGDIGQSIYYFNKAHYSKAYFEKVDDYKYDFDILDSIERMAKPYVSQKAIKENRTQTKVVFLIYGLSHTNSALVKLNLKWLENIQNKDVHIVIVDKKHTIDNDESISKVVTMLNMGYKVHIFPDKETDSKRLVHIVQSIKDLNADVVVTGAAMAKYEHAFIVASKPAPKILGFLYGPPEQFCYPFMDGLITTTYHPALDAPAKNITFEQISYTSKKIVKKDRTEFLNLPLDSIILTSVGRYPKFQSKIFLKKIETVLMQHPNSYYVVCGIDKTEIASSFDEKVLERVICTGWIENVSDYLSITDIFIDTYPSGGGLTVLEAFNYKIPTVMFKNNFNKKYTQKEWSLEKELMNIPELVIEDVRNNQFERLIEKLIKEPKIREEFGEKLYIHLRDHFFQNNGVL